VTLGMIANILRVGCGVVCVSVCALAPLAFRSSPESRHATDGGLGTHLYVTWDRFEVDRCVTAWLIKRFVDSEAEFQFYPVGSPVPSEGCIAFDTPGARYERSPGRSVSDTELAEAGLDEPAVHELVRLVRATEVAFWMITPGSEEANLRDTLQALWVGDQAPKEHLQRIFGYLDTVRANGGTPPTTRGVEPP